MTKYKWGQQQNPVAGAGYPSPPGFLVMLGGGNELHAAFLTRNKFSVKPHGVGRGRQRRKSPGAPSFAFLAKGGSRVPHCLVWGGFSLAVFLRLAIQVILQFLIQFAVHRFAMEECPEPPNVQG